MTCGLRAQRLRTLRRRRAFAAASAFSRRIERRRARCASMCAANVDSHAHRSRRALTLGHDDDDGQTPSKRREVRRNFRRQRRCASRRSGSAVPSFSYRAMTARSGEIVAGALEAARAPTSSIERVLSLGLIPIDGDAHDRRQGQARRSTRPAPLGRGRDHLLARSGAVVEAPARASTTRSIC